MPKKTSGETKMIHVRMPLSLVKEIDTYTLKHKRSKTWLIVEAVSSYLRREVSAENFRQLRGALHPEDAPGWASCKTGSEWVKKLRAEERDNPRWPIL